ncbi:hypothetical protein [Dactylosporangium sp. NPDC048998]|uniref:hypothetical protein n=1 Tax=Dactylosporangium sp. NPDC048998 TaxID=3363976 RepID=UPI00371FD45A
MNSIAGQPSLSRIAAFAATAGLAGIAVFQLALALGAPWGRASWGGAYAGVLPAELRIASAVAIGVWTLALLLVLRRAGLGATTLPNAAGRWGLWVLVGVLIVSTVMNTLSPSPWERFLWAPYSLVLAGLCAVVARSK